MPQFERHSKVEKHLIALIRISEPELFTLFQRTVKEREIIFENISYSLSNLKLLLHILPIFIIAEQTKCLTTVKKTFLGKFFYIISPREQLTFSTLHFSFVLKVVWILYCYINVDYQSSFCLCTNFFLCMELT